MFCEKERRLVKLTASRMQCTQCNDTAACHLTAHSATVHDAITPVLTTVTLSSTSDVTHVKVDQFARTSNQFNCCVHRWHRDGVDTFWRHRQGLVHLSSQEELRPVSVCNKRKTCKTTDCNSNCRDNVLVRIIHKIDHNNPMTVVTEQLHWVPSSNSESRALLFNGFFFLDLLQGEKDPKKESLR